MLYIAGGRDAANMIINLTWVYDPVTNTHTQLADEPGTFQNNVPGSVAASGLLWVFGGGNPFIGGSAVNNASRSINLHVDLNKAAFPWALVSIKAPAQPATSSSGRYYNPATNTWTSSPNMNIGRSFPSGAAVGSNVLIAAGGYDGSTTLSSAEAEVVCGLAPTPTATATASPTPALSPTPTATPTPTPTPCSGRCGPTPRPRPTSAGRSTPPPRLTPPPTPTGSPRPTPAPRP